jgi:hypothetical protein
MKREGKQELFGETSSTDADLRLKRSSKALRTTMKTRRKEKWLPALPECPKK